MRSLSFDYNEVTHGHLYVNVRHHIERDTMFLIKNNYMTTTTTTNTDTTTTTSYLQILRQALLIPTLPLLILRQPLLILRYKYRYNKLLYKYRHYHYRHTLLTPIQLLQLQYRSTQTNTTMIISMVIHQNQILIQINCQNTINQ